MTALGLAEDLKKGLIDRFRSLPTARASVLAGRTLADVLTNLLSIGVLLATGLLIGFTFDASALEILGGVGLLLLFGFAFSWIFALIGMSVSSPEAANGVGFTLIFPITFISAAFVPVESMPSGLQQVAEANPITVVVDAMRALWLDAPGGRQRLGRGRVVGGADRDLRAAGGGQVPPHSDAMTVSRSDLRLAPLLAPATQWNHPSHGSDGARS